MTDHLSSELARRRRETAVAAELDYLAPVAEMEMKRSRTTRSFCSSCAVIPP